MRRDPGAGTDRSEVLEPGPRPAEPVRHRRAGPRRPPRMRPGRTALGPRPTRSSGP